jgi:ferric-dicitrate binding protein FerR (iron transport regulator)
VKGQHYAELFRRLMQRLYVEPSPSLPSDRRRLVAAVEQALRARARRRVLVRRAVALTVGAAAVLALVVGAGHLGRRSGAVVDVGKSGGQAGRALTVLGAGGDVRASAGSEDRPLEAGMSVGPGLTLRAPASGEVRVGTADGTQLTLEPRTELSVTEASETQRFALRTGAVRVRVSRLFAGQRFIIDTADAELEVHGTVFRVAVVAADPSCGDGSTTRLSVAEGVVSVRVNGREVGVAAGDTWPSGCDSALFRIEPVERAAGHAAPRRPRASGGEVQSTTPATPTSPAAETVARPLSPASDLAAQNDLFATAVRAKNAGQLADAARLFGALADAHPRGPLVESATVQRMKALAAINPAAGARAAADYLARFPNGFARPEAVTLAGATPP